MFHSTKPGASKSRISFSINYNFNMLENFYIFRCDIYSFITGSYDRTCKIWETATGAEVGTLEGHKNVVYTIAFNRPASGNPISFYLKCSLCILYISLYKLHIFIKIFEIFFFIKTELLLGLLTKRPRFGTLKLGSASAH